MRVCVCVLTSTLTYSQQLVNLVGAESSQCVCVCQLHCSQTSVFGIDSLNISCRRACGLGGQTSMQGPDSSFRHFPSFPASVKCSAPLCSVGAWYWLVAQERMRQRVTRLAARRSEPGRLAPQSPRPRAVRMGRMGTFFVYNQISSPSHMAKMLTLELEARSVCKCACTWLVIHTYLQHVVHVCVCAYVSACLPVHKN